MKSPLSFFRFILIACCSLVLTLSSLLALPVASDLETPPISIPFVTIADPNNGTDPISNYGAVAEIFQIGKTDVTVQQYTVFLNTVAATDDYCLYDTNMFSDVVISSIERHGESGNYTYSVVPGQEETPIVYVSWFSAARFCNWLENSQQGPGTTEYGSYTLPPFNINNDNDALINSDATYFLPSPDQWYKATYYCGGGSNAPYFYPDAASLLTWTGAYGVVGLIGNQVQWLSSDHRQYGPFSNYGERSWGSLDLKVQNLSFRVAKKSTPQ